MNLLILKIEKFFTNKASPIACGGLLVSVLFFSVSLSFAWDVDLSRRIKNVETNSGDELRWPSSLKPAEELFAEKASPQAIFSSLEPAQTIVILHTNDGFVPDTVRLRKDGNYKIYIANVNEKFKNASFTLDSFEQNHGIYFGQPKSFSLNPKLNGIFTFLCPESGAQGKITVFSDSDSAPAPLASIPSEVKK